MEVHAHTHTARKKWTNYFWEFLMLFLAVFCGFLAENQREHMIEHRKEQHEKFPEIMCPFFSCGMCVCMYFHKYFYSR